MSDAQLDYAADDAEDLLALYDALNERLDVLNRRALVIEVSKIFSPPPAKSEKISLSRFRNLWQLNGPQQAALSALLGWYNGLKSHRGAPHYKTLFSVAARLPEDARTLGDIKGVNPRFARGPDGQMVLDLISEARETADDSASQSKPSPYATFDEYFRDAWVSCARAELSARLTIAPEVAFPPWLMKRIRQAIQDTIDPADLAIEFTGWRRCLAQPWLDFCKETSA